MQNPNIKDIIGNPVLNRPYARLCDALLQNGGRQLKLDRGIFYLFEKGLWRQIELEEVEDLVRELDSVFKRSMADRKRRGRADPAFQTRSRKDIRQLRQARLRVDQLPSIRAIIEAGKAQWRHAGFRDTLDTNPDVVGCAGHVIDLRTGTMRPGRPMDHISRQLGCGYGGLELATPDVDCLMSAIFAGDAAVVQWVQKLLNYGLTAHTIHNILVVGYGSGGNGVQTSSWCMNAIGPT